MAINKNHEFEELDGVKCGIVEKNVPPERVSFLKELLELNGYTVVTVPSPAPKAAPAKATADKSADGAPVADPNPAPPPPPPRIIIAPPKEIVITSASVDANKLIHKEDNSNSSSEDSLEANIKAQNIQAKIISKKAADEFVVAATKPG